MKIAFIGVSNQSLELAQYYFELGAHVNLFADPQVDDFTQIPQILTPAIKPFPVKRVTKRYLNLDEEINGRSRFFDLFRVVFTVKPKESKQAENLSEKDIEALQDEIEFYDDVDIVVDARTKELNRMGPGGEYAINEIYHNKKFIDYMGVSSIDLASVKNLAVIGTKNIERISDELKMFLQDSKKRIFLIEHQFGHKYPEAVVELEQQANDNMQNDIAEFEKKIDEWKQLEDYEKVKVPRPKEPHSQLTHMKGHTVISCDRLSDHQEFFLTVEAPEFRQGNSSLITINCDAIIVMQGFRSPLPINNGLLEKEIGFFKLKDNEMKTHIISSIEKLFTRKED